MVGWKPPTSLIGVTALPIFDKANTLSRTDPPCTQQRIFLRQLTDWILYPVMWKFNGWFYPVIAFQQGTFVLPSQPAV